MMTDKRGNTSICQNDFLTLSDLNLNTGKDTSMQMTQNNEFLDLITK